MIQGSNRLVDLRHGAEADDGGGDGRIGMEEAQGAVIRTGLLAAEKIERLVPGQAQNAAGQRVHDDHADAVCGGIGDVVLFLAIHQVVRDSRGHEFTAVDGRAEEFRGAMERKAEPDPDQAVLLRLAHALDKTALGERRLERLRFAQPPELIEVEIIEAGVPQRLLDRGAHDIRRGRLGKLPLAGEKDLLPTFGDGAPHPDLALAVDIAGGAVRVIHSQIEAVVHDPVAGLLRRPTHGAETHSRQLNPTLGKRFVNHKTSFTAFCLCSG